MQLNPSDPGASSTLPMSHTLDLDSPTSQIPHMIVVVDRERYGYSVRHQAPHPFVNRAVRLCVPFRGAVTQVRATRPRVLWPRSRERLPALAGRSAKSSPERRGICAALALVERRGSQTIITDVARLREVAFAELAT